VAEGSGYSRKQWLFLASPGAPPRRLRAARWWFTPCPSSATTRLCDQGSAADLRDLADAARLSGDTPRSVLALTTLRRRFPGADPAAEAAFLLGVIAFDSRGEYPEAAQ
jgi:hypothetical protein